MSIFSEDSIKKEDLISHLGHEDQIDDLMNEDYGLDNQMDFLENNYAVMENINKFPSDKNKFENLREEDILKNSILLREIINQKSRIEDVEQLNSKLTKEINTINADNLEKSNEITFLKNEIETLQLEKKNNLYGAKQISVFKEFDQYTKMHVRYNSGISNTHVKRHSNNRESMSSLASSTTNHTMNLELEKLQKEKVGLENQLVMYKFKYAEQSSKILEIEDERDAFRKKFESLSDKIRIKEEIIKSLINERDSLRQPTSHTRPKAFIRQNTEKVFKGNYASANHSPERTERNRTNKEIYMQTDVQSNMDLKTDRNSQTTTNMEGGKTPSGFAKIFKNIFSSEKK